MGSEVILRVTVLSETTINPITKMGERAGICWGADITDPKKNYKRGMSCLESNHGRVLEYVDVELCIENVSARVVREYYTHIGGSPTRLQASTRYSLDEDTPFEFIIPNSISTNQKCNEIYKNAMQNIWESIKLLKELDTPNEDATMLLPLGSSTKIVDKRNLRNHIDMSHSRLCKIS